VRNDYLVDFRTEASIKAVAERARSVLDSSGHPDFRVIDSIRRITEGPVLKCGVVQLRRFVAKQGGALAFVQFKPSVVLNVDDELWAEVEDNYPWARKVMAHELGHIALHEHYMPAFSGNKDKWIPVNER
jgi:Zn-dependent peptidase ImmA (M78 family)